MELKDARAKYRKHKATAKQRNIPFLLTFDEWCNIWQQSGKWELRGRKGGCYVMARHGDIGPYSVNNVSVIPFEHNVRDAQIGNTNNVGRVGWNKGKKIGPLSNTHKQKIRDTWTGKKLTEEWKENIRKSHIGVPHPISKITCPHCNLMGAANNMKRYHMDNCKIKSNNK